jgi:UDP:flavonoid glycosyltransferase YjiC (YdhE family)
MRVLFTSTPAYGHVHPPIPLALALARRGHQVRWATGVEACARLARVGIDAVTAGLPEALRRPEYRRRYPEHATLPPEERPDHMFPKIFGAIAAPPMLDDLLPIVREWKPGLLVSDSAELAGPIAAAATGIPHATHSFGALTPPHRVSAAAEEVAPLWRQLGLEPRPFAGLYDGLYLDIYPPSLQAEDMTHVERQQLLRPESFDSFGDDGLPAELAGRAGPLVYLTFGTIWRDNPVFRAAVEAIRALDVAVLVTVGPEGDPGMFGPQPANVVVERYVPQTLVLERCNLVVSHGGSGTTIAGLARGVPQLCLPQGADQFINALSCERAGAGLWLHPDRAGRDAIRAAAERLLGEPAFRAAAAGIAAEIARMPAPDEVATVLESLA